MTRFRVRHHTQYRYGRPMADGFTRAFLLPRSTAQQDVVLNSVRVDPEPDEMGETTDVFGNRVLQFAVHRAHDTLDVLAESEVDVVPTGDLPDGPAWEVVASEAAAARGDRALDVGPFLAHSPLVPGGLGGLGALVAAAFVPGRPVVDAVRALCHAVHSSFVFDQGVTDVSTPLRTVLAEGRGVCQDFAHVAVACLRSVGLPARYVSGYIETDPPPGQPRMVGTDASHAWVAAWVPDVGWIDLDPTNDQMPTSRHVTLAWGRDYSDVPPVRGVVIGPAAEQWLTVAVDVVSETR